MEKRRNCPKLLNEPTQLRVPESMSEPSIPRVPNGTSEPPHRRVPSVTSVIITLKRTNPNELS